MEDLLNQSKKLKEWSVKHRRHLHQYPELSLKEENTAKYCADMMTALGYDVKSSWGYGFTADLNINAKKTIAWRADMDALPIQEKNNHEFVSKNSGVAHMCGHDAHMAIALTAARLLSENKKNLNCNVRFIFQPSEEQPPGGAIKMIEQGCLENVDEIYGLHNDPGTELGKIKTRIGPLTAAADKFELIIKGRGGHAAKPQDCLDPIIAGSSLITNWQSILTRKIDPVHPAILSVTKFQSGNTFNVIPDFAEIAGTVRTFYEKDRQLIENSMEHSLLPFIKSGYQCEFNYIRGYDPIVNHEFGVKRVFNAAKELMKHENIEINIEPAAFGEDFSYFLQHCPGAFFVLGSGNSSKGISEPLHSAKFNIDENALPIGGAIAAKIILTTN